MENLVITFKYRNGDINQIMSTSDYEKLIQRFGLMELENILLDDEKNCLNVGVNPDQVLIDVYENARLVPVQSEPGTLSSFLGEVYDYKVEGKKLKNILVVSEKPLTFV
jgi:hypothetical protein